jgi:hypothetical protein
VRGRCSRGCFGSGDRVFFQFIFEHGRHGEMEPGEDLAAVKLVLFFKNAHLGWRFVNVNLAEDGINHPNQLNSRPEVLLALDGDLLGQVGGYSRRKLARPISKNPIGGFSTRWPLTIS